MVVSPLLARLGRRAWPRRRRVRAARPSADSLLGRLRVGFAWRSPCAALRKAACAEGASGASFRKCAPPAAGEGRAAARLLRGQGGEAAPQRRSIRCTPVQHSAAWWAACWCCARCLRGGFGVVLPAEASGARHARRRAWPGQSQRTRSMSQPARRERRASWHIVCMLPSILWSTAVNLTIVDQNRRAL